jgi:hypothetical protein
VIESHELMWRKSARGFALHLHDRGRALLTVVPDGTWPMWRIRHPDGTLSDFTNISRAKDAGIALALAILNHHQKSNRDMPSEAPRARQNRLPLPWAASNRSDAPTALPANGVCRG